MSVVVPLRCVLSTRGVLLQHPPFPRGLLSAGDWHTHDFDSVTIYLPMPALWVSAHCAVCRMPACVYGCPLSATASRTLCLFSHT